MQYLSNLLTTTFAADLAASSTETRAYLDRIRQNPDRRQLEGLRNELVALHADESTDWVALLDEHEVNATYASQNEAKRFLVENIWNVLFDEPIHRVPAV